MKRRRFLSGMALAAAGASVTSGGLSADREKLSPCPQVPTPMRDVEGRVAFITGGSSGIGLGIARALTDAGMKVVIGYRTREHLDQTLKKLERARDRIHAISVDVSDRAGMEKAAAEAVERFGRVHVLINNAGVIATPPLSQTSYEEWDWLMGVNLNGVFNGVRAFLPRIKEHGEGGQIITTSSVLGLFAAGGDAAAYCISKFAVVGMMEVLRAELADANIGVSAFCPGVVQSNLFDSGRNRPRDQTAGASRSDAEMDAARESLRNSPISTDPIEVGKLVLKGMRNNDLYILTHPEFEPFIQRRNEVLLSSMRGDQHASEARVEMVRSMLRKSIYSVERDRRLCGGTRRS